MRMLMLTLFACCVVGCIMEEPSKEGDLVEQLELSSKNLAAKGLPLRIVSYTPAASLETEDAMRSIEEQILDDSAMVPQYNGMEASSFRLSTIHERMQAFHAGDDEQNVVANIKSMAFPSIKMGQKVLDITWESQGQQFHTKCVYDENGIVYDNMLSNIAFVVTEEPASEAPRAPAEEEMIDATALANQSWSTRFLNYTITWVWGGTRGKIEMDHYVISCDGWYSFCDDGGAVNAWMSVGSASGRTGRNALWYPRISKLAWGYGWATPTASFSIAWNSGSLTFSVSTSGVGSAGKGSGIHTIY